MNTKIMYTCVTCGRFNRPVDVRLPTAAEDIVVWLRLLVIPAISADHRKVSPNCIAQAMDRVALPLDKDGNVRRAE